MHSDPTASMREVPYGHRGCPMTTLAVLAVCVASMVSAATALASESGLEAALSKAADSAPELVVLIILVVVFMRDRAALLDTVSRLQSQALERMTAISEAHAKALRDSANTNAAALHETSAAVSALQSRVEQLGIHIEHLGDRR